MSPVPAIGETVALVCWCGHESQEVVARNPRRGFAVARCRECDTHHLYPRPVSDENEAGAYYDDASTCTARYSAVAERFAREYAKRIAPLCEGLGRSVATLGRTVDVGCGGGQFVAELRSRGVLAEGLDLDPAVIAHARESHPGVKFTRGFVGDLPSAAFDALTAFNTLEHVPDPAEFIRTVSRKLVPGGLFIGSVPNIDSQTFRVLGGWWTGLLVPDEHVTMFGPRTLERCVATAGFRDFAWRTVPNHMLSPLDLVVQPLRELARRRPAKAARCAAWWTVETWARLRTRMSRRPERGEQLFWIARTPGGGDGVTNAPPAER